MSLIDLKALSVITSLSVPTLRKFIKLGMPVYQVERKILVDREECITWIKKFKKNKPSDYNDIDQLYENTISKFRDS